MKVYIWQAKLEFDWPWMNILKEEMEKNWIDCLLPVFIDEEKAKEFCWEQYLLMARDDNP